jgi:hypothetical protein
MGGEVGRLLVMMPAALQKIKRPLWSHRLFE